jgi:uncharacterized protein YecE (DUF72 family)
MTGRAFVGTSGFDYPQWRGSFYPASLRRQDMLAYYASRFGSVEINYTFRHEASVETLASWRAATQSGFVFSLKAHQRLTHWQRLSAPDDATERFLAGARTLGDRLGPILFQLPPTLRADPELLDRFVARLPADLRFAFEFRHDSWKGIDRLLEPQGIARCVAETDEDAFREELPAGPFVYLRLRRTSYGRARLRTWARRIGEATAAGRDVFCYFKHEEAGAGAAFGQALLRLLAAPQSAAASTSAPRSASSAVGSSTGSPSPVVT